MTTPPTFFELELPAAYLDAIVEDQLASSTTSLPVLINQDPEAGETKVPGSAYVQVDVATLLANATITQSSLKLYVNGVLALSGTTFQSGFTGSVTFPTPNVARLFVQPARPFASLSVNYVEVVAASGVNTLDTSYSFTIADTTPPVIMSAVASDQQTVNVTFGEAVIESLTGLPASALTATNFFIDRFGDYLNPVASVNVTGVTVVTTQEVALETDIPLTPGATYQLKVTGVTDLAGNAIVVGANTAVFLGWKIPIPPGRSFDIYNDKLPKINRNDDDSKDLYRFIACLQEVTGLLLYTIDKFIEIIDPDLAPEEFVDAMLADLGNPFNFDLVLADKRRLAQVLVQIYLQKGTELGITSVIRFFMGIEVTIDVFNSSTNVWVLGESYLDDGSGVGTTVLATAISKSLYSFNVIVTQVLTPDQITQLTSIVQYMKPAHTHFITLVQPVVPVVIDSVELGLSTLGVDWMLH